MPFNGSGVFSRLYSWVADRDAGTKILASRMDAETNGIVTGLNSIVDGTQAFTAPVRTSYGTAATPAHSFKDDPDNGIFRKSADVLGFSVGGVEKLSLSSAGLFDGTAEFYRQNNIIGTVSQAAGVPTGAIVQRGSNSGGEFVRFADGTQICTTDNGQALNTNTAVGPTYRSSVTGSWTYPASFASITNLVTIGTTQAASTYARHINAYASTAATGLFYQTSPIQSVDTFATRLVAIGRWF